MSNDWVVPLYRVIANGSSRSKGKNGKDAVFLHLTIIASPIGAKEGIPSRFQLQDWPSAIMRGLKDKVWNVTFRDVVNNARSKSYELKAITTEKIDINLASHLGKLWVDCLTRHVPNGNSKKFWEDLAKDISDSAKGDKRSVDLKPSLDANDKPPLHNDGAISAARPTVATKEQIVSAFSVRQADYAAEDELARAARILAKAVAGPAVLVDDNEQDLTSSDSGIVADPKDFTDNAAALYSKVVNNTNAARGRSVKLMSAIKSLLKNSPSVEAVPPIEKEKPEASALSSGVSQTSSVNAVSMLSFSPNPKAVDYKRRWSHAYFTWPQRSIGLEAKLDDTKVGETAKAPRPDGKKIDKEIDGRKTEDRGLTHARAVFFALQGDPILARLFGLAIDVRLELPAELDTVDTRYLHLEIKAPTGVPRVATAARLHAEAGDVRFWPVSRFREVLVTRTPLPDAVEDQKVVNALNSLIEQEDGFYFGASKLISGERRYDVTTLDLRSSVEGKDADRDRGEALHSVGLKLLDRGRGDQIVRDLVLFEDAKEKLIPADGQEAAAAVVLYAEELTTGRRVDVAVFGRNANGKLAPSKWRSLMSRIVDYDFGKNDKVIEALLDKLVPGAAGVTGAREETSFQLTARTIPLGSSDAGAVRIEAVAEEAIFMWTGMPAALHVGGTKETLSDLPFSRTLDLPKLQTPPPLRYGVPYGLRLRASFLGGGAALLNAPAGDALDRVIPAAKDGEPRPRRFLRHEGIAPPLLMLPAHIATMDLGRMGVEQVDQAFVRTSESADPGENGNKKKQKELDDLAKEAFGAPYVELGNRDIPSTTMRIFLPPVVTPFMVEKHGMLDDGKAAMTLRGGLLDVEYAPRPDDLTPTERDGEPPVVGFGFPVAVIERVDALDPEGAIDRRRILKPGELGKEKFKESGALVFKPGMNAVPEKKAGYLPDPAADIYCVRARRRGSERYLDGFLSAKIYDGKAYPHALPLAIVLEKKPTLGGAAARSKEHVSRIEQISVVEKKVMYLNKYGLIQNKLTSGAVRVQVIKILLKAHEDFDLEVSCLPTAERLARDFAVTETLSVTSQLHESLQSAHTNTNNQRLNIAPDFSVTNDKKDYSGVDGNDAPSPKGMIILAKKLFDVMSNRWPIEEIAANTSLRVCHALNLPAEADLDTTMPISAFRPKKIERGKIIDPDEKKKLIWNNDQKAGGEPLATDLILGGKIVLDLSEIDGFDIVATTVGADGQPLDNINRKRSDLSRRSGRWPQVLSETGDLDYANTKSVYGFTVAANGEVTLPPSDVTLLSVRNLPTHGAIGKVVGPGGVVDEDATGLLFGHPSGPNGKTTTISLWPLFAAAYLGESIKLEFAVPPNTIDNRKRAQLVKLERPNSFVDAMARNLKLSVITISRHATDFETAPRYRSGEKEQTYYRRQPLLPQHQSRRSGPAASASVFMPATKRPAMVDALRPEPAFRLERSGKDLSPQPGPQSLRQERKVVRRSVIRLWLGRGWYDSGEGERLGIVLWPPNYQTLTEENIDKDLITINGRPNPVSLRDFDDADLGPGGGFVTRWGGDPIRKDDYPQKGFFIPPNAFEDLKSGNSLPHFPKFVSEVQMPMPTPKDAMSKNPKSDNKSANEEPTAFLPVSLLTYVPCFDIDREQWYVDVDLRTKTAAEPFVRIGLVRYQENSIDKSLCVSQPVKVMIPLLPERSVTVDHSRDTAEANHVLEILVSGPAGVGAKSIGITEELAGSPETLKKWQDAVRELQHPHMLYSIFHESEREDGTLIRRPVGEEANQPKQLAHTGTGSGSQAGNHRWEGRLELSTESLAGLGKGKVVIYVEEVDRRMPASYRREPISFATMFDKSTFVDSGPRFAARVPIMEL